MSHYTYSMFDNPECYGPAMLSRDQIPFEAATDSAALDFADMLVLANAARLNEHSPAAEWWLTVKVFNAHGTCIGRVWFTGE